MIGIYHTSPWRSKMQKPNLALKAAIIETDATLKNFVIQLDGRSGAEKLTEQRLGRIIHHRSEATDEEKRVISWRLQKPITEIFAE
jgi:hypothetical protein